MKKPTRSRKGHEPNTFELFRAYLLNHAHSLFASLGRLSRTPLTSFLTVLVLAVTISLAAGFYILVANAQQLTGSLEASNQMSLFLKNEVSDSIGEKLAQRLSGNPAVALAKFISKTQAMNEFKAHSGFGEALNALENNPLPGVIEIMPKDSLEEAANIADLMDQFKKLPEVEFVQMDMQWVERLRSIMLIANRGVALISVLLGLAVAFITANTIRLELQNRRDEVYISKLVGATQDFIQRPFLYTGFWLGFLGGFVAWLIVSVMLLILSEPVEGLSSLYDGAFHLLFMSFSEFVLLLMISSALAVFGAKMVLHQQLKRLKPE